LAADIQVVDTALAHLDPVARLMRVCDQREVWAAAHATPLQALQEGYRTSPYCKTALLNGEPVLIAGVAVCPGLLDFGVPWALATRNFGAWSRTFLRLCRAYVGEMNERFPRLENMVDARNTASIHWLEWCGFKVERPAIPFGPDYMPFFRFHMERC
jgi:hypothetical protein